MTNDTTNDTTTDLVNEHTSLHISGAAVMNDHERRLNLLESSLDKVVSGLLSILTPKDEGQEPDDGMTDSEADADALASAGFGTDEDYGGSDDRL
jgi:hypothetical protein